MHNFFSFSRGQKLVLAAVILAFLFAGVLLLDELGRGGPAAAGFEHYDSELLGVSFDYPSTYFLKELDIGDGHRAHRVVILVEDTAENRAVWEGQSEGREGPPTITFEFFQSPETLDPLTWVQGTSFSNYKLGNGAYEEIEVASGQSAVSYHWSGLYEADSIAFQNRDYIGVATAMYLSPDDRTRKDFPGILETLELR